MRISRGLSQARRNLAGSLASGGIEDRGDWWAGVGQVMEYVTVADSVGDGA